MKSFLARSAGKTKAGSNEAMTLIPTMVLDRLIGGFFCR
jgi:hypothetical protein